MALLRRRGAERVEPTLAAGPGAKGAAKAAKSERAARTAPTARPTRADRVEDRARTAPSKRAGSDRQRQLDLPPPDGTVRLPTLDLLEDVEIDQAAQSQNREGLEQNARMLEGVLEDFGVKGEIVKVRPGPVVTLYELEPAPGTKTSRVIGLSDDIARSMSAVSVRIATVPGRSVIGIELPNAKREMVGLRELLASNAYEHARAKLPVVLGKDIGGAAEIADLAGMPHLLVAGTTGSGKSVGLNAMILSLLYKLTPDQCRFIMIDPKMLELSVYDAIPHLLAPVVTDPKKAVVALKWTVREMEDRYRAMSKLSVRNVEGYNKRVAEAAKKGEVITRTVQTGFDQDTGKPIFEEEPLDLTPLPYIVVIVDEMADLMLVAGKDIEASIQRLAQMARAAGIHLIMATQRPSVDVITGTIKANFPTRISFMVTSKIDSRTILGEQGAEQLLGKGDMLFMAGGGRITRIHGPFVDDNEVEAVCRYLRHQAEPDYLDAVTDEDDMSGGFDTDVSGATAGFGAAAGGGAEESLYDQAVALVAREGKCSTSFIQRHLQIGYNRAARIVEQMEKEGVAAAGRMRRAAVALLAAGLAALAGAPAAAESDAELIARVEAYFDGVTTLESRFIQTNPDGAYVDGVIRLQRPGRMRIDYAPEAGLEVIANGTFFILVDHRLEEATYLPLEATPAHLLLREDFRLGEEIAVLGVDRGAGLVRLALARKGEEAAGTVTVTLNADPLQLRQWTVEDAQGQRTRVTLLDPRFGLAFDPDLFTFENPYGPRQGGGN
eukprot:g15199.t1